MQQDGIPCACRIGEALVRCGSRWDLSFTDVRQDLFGLRTALPSPVTCGYARAIV